MAIPESDPAKIADLGVFGGLVERTSRDAHHRRPEVDNDGGPPVATSDHASGGPIPAACVSSTADPDALGRIRSPFGASFSDLRTNRFEPSGPSRESNLLHQAHEVVEEPLLRDLPLIIPRGHRTELHMETLPGWRNDLPLRDLHWSLHRAGEFRDGARVVAVREEKLVRAVDEVVVREGLEEFNGFHVMVVPASRGWGPAGAVHGNIFGVTLSKSLPKRASRSGIPSIVQRRHQIDQLFLFHVQPLSRIIGVFQEALPIPATGSRTLARHEFILHSPTSRGEFDAWARIRTWEPLREGILSPSSLTGLGYPRAARETPGAVKPFLVQPSRAPVSQRLIPSRTVPKGRNRWRNTSLKPFSKRWRIASTRIPNGPGKPRPSRRKSS